MKRRSIRITVTVPATPREVFAALTDGTSISQWSEQKGRVEPRVGGKFEMFDGWVKGKVLIYKPGKQLAYTWQPSDWDGTVKSIVQFRFAPTKSGTRITVTHTGFPSERERKNHHAGWLQYVFDPLKDYFLMRRS
jgi:uncharacterized protein YndB with AHSA1/START domain